MNACGSGRGPRLHWTHASVMSPSPPHVPGTACQTMPAPPPATGLVLDLGPGDKVASGETPDGVMQPIPSILIGDKEFNPKIPFFLPIPEGGICEGDLKVVIVGNIPTDGKTYPEFVVKGPGPRDEAFHVMIGLEEETVWSWGVNNGSMEGQQGEAGEGTTIDVEEPFVLT